MDKLDAGYWLLEASILPRVERCIEDYPRCGRQRPISNAAWNAP